MDYEANITKIEGGGVGVSPTGSFTQKTRIHEACGHALRAVCSEGSTLGPSVYRGPDAVKKSLQELQTDPRKEREREKKRSTFNTGRGETAYGCHYLLDL